MRRTIGLVAMLALAPLALHAQTQGQASAAGRAESAAQQQQAQARVQATLQAAVEAGVPVRLLEMKMAEGKAKGVPMARIAAAMEQRLENLMRAQDVMRRGNLTQTTEGELSLAADALQAGVSERALVEITRRSPQERRAVAVAVLSDLVALGHASENALARVTAAMQKGNRELVNLQARTSSELRARGGTGAGAGVSVGASTGARIDLPARGRKPDGR